MNAGRSLQDLAAELERQSQTRKDYLAPQGKLDAQVIDDEVKIVGLNGAAYGLTPHAHRQLTDHLKIPGHYYQRMQAEQPDLLATNIRTWLHAAPAEGRMVRTLDGRVRAFMSAKYRPLDNFDLANVALPKLIDLGARVLSAELTETRMYIKAILPSLSDDLPEGVQWGTGHARVAEYNGNEPGKLVASIVISNSDVGAGSLRLEPSVFTTWCTNLAVMVAAAMKKYHVGRGHELTDDLSVYRDETREADDKAFWLKVQDVTAAAFDRKYFEAAVEQIKLAGRVEIVSENLPAVVDMAVRELDLPKPTTSGILGLLAKGGDFTKWGLASAITAQANVTKDYEISTALERAGGKVIAMPEPAWKMIATADVVDGELVTA